MKYQQSTGEIISKGFCCLGGIQCSPNNISFFKRFVLLLSVWYPFAIRLLSFCNAILLLSTCLFHLQSQGCFYQGNWDMSDNCISEGLKSCMKAELRPNEFQKKLIHLLNLLKMPKCELKMLFFANLSFLSCILVIFIS